MIDVPGKVVGVDGDLATVRVDSRGGCGRCHEPGGCGGVQLTQVFCARPEEVTVPNREHATVGEDVMVSVSSAAFYRGVITGYGIPLVGVLLGAIVGSMLIGSDLGAIIFSGLGLVGAWGIVHRRRLGQLDVQSDLSASRRKT